MVKHHTSQDTTPKRGKYSGQVPWKPHSARTYDGRKFFLRGLPKNIQEVLVLQQLKLMKRGNGVQTTMSIADIRNIHWT